MRGSRPHDFAEKVPRKALHRPQLVVLERDGGFSRFDDGRVDVRQIRQMAMGAEKGGEDTKINERFSH